MPSLTEEVLSSLSIPHMRPRNWSNTRASGRRSCRPGGCCPLPGAPCPGPAQICATGTWLCRGCEKSLPGQAFTKRALLLFAVGTSWKGKTSDKAKVERVKGTMVFFFSSSSCCTRRGRRAQLSGSCSPGDLRSPGTIPSPSVPRVLVEAELRDGTSYLFLSAPEIPVCIFLGML